MAAYAQDFVVSILGANGKPIRESNESGDRTVRIPFETEYKIRLKNKNNRRAKVQVFVDGMDISPGRMFLLRANETIDLERFIQDGDLTKGNRFKFVNREKGAATGEIQDPSNDKLGNIEVLFHREIPWSYWTTTYNWPTTIYGGGCFGNNSGGLSTAGILNLSTNGSIGINCANSGNVSGGGGNTTAAFNVQACATNTATGQAGGTSYYMNSTPTGAVGQSTMASAPVSDVGGTAMGSDSNQLFHDSCEYFQVESFPIRIELTLKGLQQAQPQPHPVMTSMAPQIPVFDSTNTLVYDVNGNMLGLIKRMDLHFNMEKSYVEVEIRRKHPKTGAEVYDNVVLSAFQIDPSGRLTIRLAAAVTNVNAA